MQIFHLPRDRFQETPTVVKRWGFLFLATTLLLAAGSVFMTGCASSGKRSCITPEAARFSASQDSLGLNDFLALPEEQQAERRKVARAWIKQANSEGRSDAKIKALTNAVGLAPDNPDAWLRLAHIWRWIGDYFRTSTCLENAAAAVRKLDSSYTRDEIKDAQRRTALARAWLHYDRAEYREGMRWARAGEEISPGDIWIRQIRGLLEGSLNHRSRAHEIAGDMARADSSDQDPRWVMAVLDRAQSRYREAFNYVAPLRPEHEHSAECYRDMGEIAEHLTEWSYARRWYEESASALPFNDTSCLTQISFTRLEPDRSGTQLPIWLAFDRYFITGSLSSYTALALHNFERVTVPTEKEFWAGQVVNSAGILLRKDMHRAWSLRARGIIFAEKEITERAMRDLREASRLLADIGLRDSRVEGLLGHLLLAGEKPEQAEAHLREAVSLDGNYAEAWSDLGLCLIMVGVSDEAEEALTTAIKLDPGLATAWYNRGLMYLHAGNLDQAEADLNQAARLAPGNPEIGKLLQQVHLRQGSE